MKEFVLPQPGDRDHWIMKFVMSDSQLNLLLVFLDYLVYGSANF